MNKNKAKDKQEIINKYIDRIKTDYPEDDKLQIDLEQFFQELKEIMSTDKNNSKDRVYD